MAANPAREAGLGDALRLDFAGDLLCFGGDAPARGLAFDCGHAQQWIAGAPEANQTRGVRRANRTRRATPRKKWAVLTGARDEPRLVASAPNFIRAPIPHEPRSSRNTGHSRRPDRGGAGRGQTQGRAEVMKVIFAGLQLRIRANARFCKHETHENTNTAKRNRTWQGEIQGGRQRSRGRGCGRDCRWPRRSRGRRSRRGSGRERPARASNAQTTERGAPG